MPIREALDRARRRRVPASSSSDLRFRRGTMRSLVAPQLTLHAARSAQIAPRHAIETRRRDERARRRRCDAGPTPTSTTESATRAVEAPHARAPASGDLVAADVTPEEVDEDRDREEERDPERARRARRERRPRVEHDDARRRREDREAARRRITGEDALTCRHVGADAERRGDEGSDREPEEARPRLGRRVEPRREHREQRERPVRVVELVRARRWSERSSSPRPTCATISVWASASSCATKRPARPRRQARTRRRPTRHSRAITRNAFTWCAVSIGERNTTREERDVIEEGKPAPDFELKSDSGETRQALRPAREAGRPLLLSQGRHARLHDSGVRDPRRLRRVRAARARSCSASRPTTRRRTSSSRTSTTCRSRCSPTPTTRSPSSTASGARRRTTGKTYLGVDRSTFVIDADGNVKKVMRKVKPATHADDVLAALGGSGRERRRLLLAPRGVASPSLSRERRSELAALLELLGDVGAAHELAADEHLGDRRPAGDRDSSCLICGSGRTSTASRARPPGGAPGARAASCRTSRSTASPS